MKFIGVLLWSGILAIASLYGYRMQCAASEMKAELEWGTTGATLFESAFRDIPKIYSRAHPNDPLSTDFKLARTRFFVSLAVLFVLGWFVL